jgi:hypothetical protein
MTNEKVIPSEVWVERILNVDCLIHTDEESTKYNYKEDSSHPFGMTLRRSLQDS